jgi:hypothetical protein
MHEVLLGISESNINKWGGAINCAPQQIISPLVVQESVDD